MPTGMCSNTAPREVASEDVQFRSGRGKHHPADGGFYAYWGNNSMMKRFRIAALFYLLGVSIACAQQYYVNGTSGLDSNSGAVGAPLKTIGAALKKANEGDTIWIASGTYREQLRLPCSGITMRAEPGADVRIKGSDVITAWTRLNGNIWQTSWPVKSQQVFVDGESLQQIGANSTPLNTRIYAGHVILPPVGTGLNDMLAGSFYYDEVNTRLYVWPHDNADPRTHTMEASVRSNLIPYNEDLQDIQLIDLQFYHSNVTHDGNSMAIVNVAGRNWLVSNCTFSDGDFAGLKIYGEGHQIINCTCDRNGDVGICIAGTDLAHSMGVWPDRPPQNILVSGCQTNYNNYRHFRWEAMGGGMKNHVSCNYVTISECRSSFNDGPGIWFDVLCNNITIDRSVVTDNVGPGIEYEISDNAVISNNVALRNALKYTYYSGIFVSSCDNVRVLNNILYGNSVGVGLYNLNRSEHPSMANNLVEDNFILSSVNSDFSLRVDSASDPASGSGNSSDRNYFYREDGTVNITYRNAESNVTYRDLGSLSRGTGMEQHSVNVGACYRYEPFHVLSNGTNLITNATFDSNISGWAKWSPGGATTISWSSEGGLDGGCLKTVNTDPNGATGQTSWSAFSLVKGSTYCLSVDMSAPVPTAVQLVACLNESPYEVYGSRYFAVGPMRKTCKLYFTSAKAVANARMHTRVNGPAEFYMDNVVFAQAEVKVNDPAKATRLLLNDQSTPKAISLGNEIYSTIEGLPVSGTVLLEPYSSMVLLRSYNNEDGECNNWETHETAPGDCAPGQRGTNYGSLPPDTVAPTKPSGLSAQVISATAIHLSWTASTDSSTGSGLTPSTGSVLMGYRIYRNGVQVGISPTNSYRDGGLSAAKSYTYRVAAFDRAGNLSGQSDPVTAKTLPASSNNVPVLAPIGSHSVPAGEPLQFTVQATDADGDVLQYSATGG